ncbi:cupredoxin domain-containing protein [Hydrogenothermus marinus]|uniref:Cupredoxin-like domain-containing protein n=1 Tax=Hydrogenothermus marinus TaxID=133270 RepID=A0A3M0BMH0_9AQUI|nr:cupredoxin domain-containing protein [Hydrogenothermus marinus]RMA96028.1 Cupredoxin-like domain-containing protein [Hydrogenothermus marinus]
MSLRNITIILILLANILFSCSKNTDEKPDVVINIEVSKNGYNPNHIEVKRGQVVLFRIKALDEGIGDDYSQSVYGHCFYILPPYDVMVQNIKKGETKQVKVKMVYPGKVLFTCPYCSGIFPTKGELIIK